MLLIMIGAEMVVAIKLLTARFKIKYIPVILNFLYLKIENEIRSSRCEYLPTHQVINFAKILRHLKYLPMSWFSKQLSTIMCKNVKDEIVK